MAAGHLEIVDASALLDIADHRSGADDERIGAVALIYRAGDGAGMHLDAVGAGAIGDVAGDLAGAAGRKNQRVVATRVDEVSNGCAAVADDGVVAWRRGEDAGG